MLTGRYRYKKNWLGQLVVQVEHIVRNPRRRIPIGQHSVTVYRNATLDDLKLIGLADEGDTKLNHHPRGNPRLQLVKQN